VVVAIMCSLPGVQINVCGAIAVVPSTDIVRPLGSVAIVIASVRPVGVSVMFCCGGSGPVSDKATAVPWLKYAVALADSAVSCSPGMAVSYNGGLAIE